MGRDRSRPGQFNYPTRNFATLGPFVNVTPDVAVGGSVISAELCMSPCRPDCIITALASRAWRAVSEDSRSRGIGPFLLISRTARVFTATNVVASSGGSTGVPSIWPGFITTVVQFYSYGRRLPGLQFRALACA
jgi:hypothetical protein